MKLQGVAIAVLIITLNVITAQDLLENDFMLEAISFFNECGSRHINSCIKEKAIRFIEQLPSDLDIGAGIKISPTEGIKRSARYFSRTSLPMEPRAREELLDTVLIDRIVNYLSSHTFQFKVPDDTIEDIKRSFNDGEEEIEEGRRKKKKKSNLMMIFQLKAAAIGALMLKTIGLVAFKAFVMAKLALVLASIVALKKLLEHKHHTSTYEVVASHPYDEHGGGGHFDRSFNPSDIAYKGHAEAKNSF